MIPEFVKLWESGFEVVAGAPGKSTGKLALRVCRGIFTGSYGRSRTSTSRLTSASYELIDRKVWQAVVQHDDHYPYIRGIIASVGFRRVIVPYTWEARQRGFRRTTYPADRPGSERNVLVHQRSDAAVHLHRDRDGGALLPLRGLCARPWFVRPDLAPRGMATVIAALFFCLGCN